MGKKIGAIITIWFLMSMVYVLLTAMMPALTGITGGAATTMAASSNMTNYPGTLEAIQAFPVYVWFIPGGLAFIATVATLKSDL